MKPVDVLRGMDVCFKKKTWANFRGTFLCLVWSSPCRCGAGTTQKEDLGYVISLQSGENPRSLCELETKRITITLWSPPYCYCPAEKDHMRNHVRNHVKNHMINHMIYHMISRAKITSTRRLRHYRSGLRALRRGRRPRQRGSVAQPEQHELSASRAASRRGAGEIHSRAAEQGRGGARRQALLPDHMSGEEVRLHANSLKEEIVLTRFRAREYQTAVRDLLGTFCNLNRLLDYVNYPLEPSEYWWQLEEQLSQELDGIDTIFGNLLAPLSS
ncbi:unnamed protein product [Trichogramma brassicae]|uniref:Uncharacterized protein n=1 Tax=Trichogramma brassicae TaxID=86971 RepID=A0A6H5J2X6_9HYME|nr:unnamed protein product [Trichogramma brassicae]